MSTKLRPIFRERAARVISLHDPFAEVRNRIHLALIEDLGPQLLRPGVDQDALQIRVREQICSRLESERGIAAVDREMLIQELVENIVGYGPIERLLADETVTKIMVNGPSEVPGPRSHASVRRRSPSSLARSARQAPGCAINGL